MSSSFTRDLAVYHRRRVSTTTKDSECARGHVCRRCLPFKVIALDDIVDWQFFNSYLWLQLLRLLRGNLEASLTLDHLLYWAVA